MRSLKLFLFIQFVLLVYTGALLAQPVLISPANGATNIVLPVTLSWSGTANFNVEVREGSMGGTLVYADPSTSSTSVVLSNPTLAYGTMYYWFITDINGTTIRNFTTSIAPPAVPTLVTPADLATGQSLTPTLTWADGGGGTVEFYHVQVASDNGFSTIVFEDNAVPGVTTSSVASGLAINTTYYWRVKAANVSGAQNSAFSSYREFTTLNGVTLTGPSDGATGVALPISFSWTGAGGPYWIQIQLAGGAWAPLVYEDNAVVGSPVNVGTPDLAYNTAYDWRVSSNGGSTWSSASFTTQGPPNAPVLVSPADGVTNQLLTLNLSWNDGGGASVDFYELEVATSNSFGGSIVYQNTTIPGVTTTWGVGPLASNTMYYWRVRAVNSLSGTSSYSLIFNFTTLEVPGVPTLLLPLDGDTYVLDMPFFTWTPNTNVQADSFLIQITPDPTFYNVHHNIFVPASYVLGQDQGYQLTVPLATGSPYYWRVRGYNQAGYGPFAAPFDFQVAASGDSMPPVPIISYPRNGETAYSLSPDLNWYVTHYAVGVTYEIEFNADGVFTGVPTQTGIVNYLFTAPGSPLDNNTTYYYKVRANRGGIYSLWSDSAAFTTLPVDVPFLPIQSWPVGNITVWSNPTQLNWYVNGNSTTLTYDVEFNTDNNFTGTPTLGFDNINANNINIPTPGIGITYYWRVRSYNGTIYSAWTATEQFRTAGWSGSATPIPSAPVSGHTVYSNDVTMSWFLRGYSASYTYNLQFSTDGNWANPLTTTDYLGLINQNHTELGLTFGSTYYWRVQSVSGATTSAWSTTSTFTVVGPNGSNIPIPSWPIGSASIPSDTVKLLWYLNGPIAGLIFDVEYNTNGIFTGTPTNAGLTATEVELTGLTNGANYFWRVRSRSSNGASTSAWSVTADFVVLSGLLSPVPRIGAPDYGITLMTVDPNLSWYVLTQGNSTKYELEYAMNPNFSNSTVVSNLTSANVVLPNLTSDATYFWRVRSQNSDETYSAYSPTASFIPTGTTSVDDILVPVDFEVAQNYPNPFNPSTTINFAIPVKELVAIRIYDVLGREVRTLLNEEKEAGYYSVQWNGDNQFGQKVSSGTYIVRVNSGSNVKTMKMTLMK
jgi:hypothetical protein